MTTLAYDALNRVTQKTYSDAAPAAVFCYDGQVVDTATNLCTTPGTPIPFSTGRLTSAASAGVSAPTTTAYDALGRALASEQKTYDGAVWRAYAFSYSYKLNGNLAAQTHPSGRNAQFEYDSSGRPSSAFEGGGGTESFLNSVAYAAHGAVDNSPARQPARRADWRPRSAAADGAAAGRRRAQNVR